MTLVAGLFLQLFAEGDAVQWTKRCRLIPIKSFWWRDRGINPGISCFTHSYSPILGEVPLCGCAFCCMLVLREACLSIYTNTVSTGAVLSPFDLRDVCRNSAENLLQCCKGRRSWDHRPGRRNESRRRSRR